MPLLPHPHSKISSRIFGLSLLTIIGFPLMWIPALGWLPDGAITWSVIKFGIVLVFTLAIYYSAYIKYLFAKTDPIIRGFLLIFSSLLYFIRILELVNDNYYLTTLQIILFTGSIIIISTKWSVGNYKSHQEKLENLRSTGLLRKYGIFDETGEFLCYKQGFLPTTDGHSPEEEATKEKQKYQWILLIPASGLVFFLIRIWSGSILWILFIINIYFFGISLSGGIYKLAYGNQIRKWEKKFRKPIYEAKK